MATMASDHRVVWLKQSVGLDGTAARVLVARRCDQVIGLGEAVVRPFAAALDGRVHVVRPGVPDYEFDRERDRREVVTALGCPSDAELIVVSGRICPQKGQQELVELAPRILAERQRARIVFIGDTSPAEREHADRLRARARALGVERRVSFLGAVEPAEDAVRFVSGCDLLVAPSMRGHRTGWEEGNGFSVVEAMYVGTPVVAYANGALPEVLGGCGAVIEEGDREGLGRAIVDVLGDQARRDRMAQCGSSHARSHHRRADAIEAMKARIRASAVASA